MNEKINRLVDELRQPVWGESVRVVNDRLRTAALFLENMEIENDLLRVATKKVTEENKRLKAQLKAAEKDMKLLIDDRYDICLFCKHYIGECPDEKEPYCFEWRGMKDGGAENDP